MQKFLSLLFLLKLSFFLSAKPSEQSKKKEKQKTQKPLIIRGKRARVYHLPELGRSEMIKTNTDLGEKNNLLQSSSSSLSQANYKPSLSSELSLAKIRTHSTQLTQIWLNDEPWLDAWYGVPAGGQLDLEALGEVRIHYGHAPWNLCSLASFGGVQYLQKMTRQEKTVLKYSSSYPSSHTVSFKTPFNFINNNNLSLSLFAKLTKDGGHFLYYDDEGNPYQKENKKRRWRENNDLRSYSLVPTLYYIKGPHHINAFIWGYDFDNGVPARGHQKSSLRTKGQGLFQTAQYRYFKKNKESGLHSTFSFSIQNRLDKLSLYDLEGLSFSTHEKDKRASKCQQESISLTLEKENASLKNKIIHSQQQINFSQSKSKFELIQREQLILSLGLRWQGFRWFQAEAKSFLSQQADELSFKERQEHSESKTKKANGYGATLAFFPLGYKLYLQAFKSSRLPNLMENFGDGISMLHSDELRKEKILHREFGLAKKFSNLKLDIGLSFFQDDIDDKILLLPASTSHLKALNFKKTKTTGYEFTVQQQYKNLDYRLSLSLISSVDISDEKNKKILAMTPKKVAKAELGYLFFNKTRAFIETHYRSKVYRDRDNLIVNPDLWLTDCGLSSKFKTFSEEISLSLLCVNLFDLDSIRVSSRNGKEMIHGLQARSEIDGYPLPGRQWQLSLKVILS